MNTPRTTHFDAIELLAAPGFHELSQNQYGAAIGGPIQKDKTFVYANYEGQRRDESPTYNSAVLQNITAINTVKVTCSDCRQKISRCCATPTTTTALSGSTILSGEKNYLYVRYFINDDRFTNQSPLE